MGVGWRSVARTAAITAAVTSAFWVIFGGWLYYRYVQSERSPVPSVARSDVPPGRLIVPVAGVAPAALTDTFSQARADGQRRHDAIDIMAPEGTPVIAAAPGKVEKLFLSHDGGNTVYERSPDGKTIYYYAHLTAYAPGLAEGAQIARGTAIGAVGHTGNADPGAPHLHFAILATSPERKWYDNAQALNPYPLLGGR